VKPHNLLILLHSTLRYSLGRMTYMPGLIQDLIKQYREVFTNEMLRQLADEIDDEHRIRGGKLGMDFDTRDWLAFRDWLRETADAGVTLSFQPAQPPAQPKE